VIVSYLLEGSYRMIDFKNLSQALAHVQEVLVIDLLQHAMSLEEDPCGRGLLPSPKGLYILGNFEPILLESERYYYKTQLLSSGGKGDVYDFKESPYIKDISKIAKFADDVYDISGKVVLTSSDIRTKGRFFRTDPGVPVTAIKMAIAVIQRYLGTLCRHTSHIHSASRMDQLVRQEYQYLIDNDEYLIGFDNLISQISQFVGNDHWNIYFYKVKGTTMVITKSCDWRVYDWYRMKFQDQDQEED